MPGLRHIAYLTNSVLERWRQLDYLEVEMKKNSSNHSDSDLDANIQSLLEKLKSIFTPNNSICPFSARDLLLICAFAFTTQISQFTGLYSCWHLILCDFDAPRCQTRCFHNTYLGTQFIRGYRAWPLPKPLPHADFTTKPL